MKKDRRIFLSVPYDPEGDNTSLRENQAQYFLYVYTNIIQIKHLILWHKLH
jgi:hypothetical protein